MTHRSDRPQVVIGLLCTGDGIPIAHHVFAGNTADVSTLPGVLEDLAKRFGVGKICVVADRGLISVDNVELVAGQGFDHVLATRLHRDTTCAEALQLSTASTALWVPVPSARSAACDVKLADGRRAVVVASVERWRRDTGHAPPNSSLAPRRNCRRCNGRVHDRDLVDAGKIGRAAQRIVGPSGVARLFDLEIREGYFLYHYNEAAFDHEALLAGRYVLTTSLPAADALDRADRGHVSPTPRRRAPLPCPQRLPAPAPSAATGPNAASAVTSRSASTPRSSKPSSNTPLAAADVRDPDLADQHLTAPRSLRELHRVRNVTLSVGDGTIGAVTRRDPLQHAICSALHIDTTGWDHAPAQADQPASQPTAPTRRDVVTTPRNAPPTTRTFAQTPPNSGLKPRGSRRAKSAATQWGARLRGVSPTFRGLAAGGSR